MKAYKNIILVVALVFAAGAGGGDSSVSTFTDSRDGKTYKIVKIGRQNWFAENLNYEAENSVCYENKAENCARYGRLYDWNTAITACPAGTHLPTDKEWTALTDYVGGEKIAGAKLKTTSGWYNFNGAPNDVGTDDYGFSALPGGRGSGYGFSDTGRWGRWWSATTAMSVVNISWERYIIPDYKLVGKPKCTNGISDAYNNLKISVRCVQD